MTLSQSARRYVRRNGRTMTLRQWTPTGDTDAYNDPEYELDTTPVTGVASSANAGKQISIRGQGHQLDREIYLSVDAPTVRDATASDVDRPDEIVLDGRTYQAVFVTRPGNGLQEIQAELMRDDH